MYELATCILNFFACCIHHAWHMSVSVPILPHHSHMADHEYDYILCEGIHGATNQATLFRFVIGRGKTYQILPTQANNSEGGGGEEDSATMWHITNQD